MTNLQPADSGLYQVMAKDGKESTTLSFTLQVPKRNNSFQSCDSSLQLESKCSLSIQVNNQSVIVLIMLLLR